MRYNRSTEWAVDSLFYMAVHPEREVFFVEEIAQAQKVSTSYLTKIFQQLVRAGLLRSRRGARGGYALNRKAPEITLLDIACAIEGTLPLYECDADVKNCTLGPKCLIVSTFREAESKMNEVLQRVTLADLLESLKAQPEQPAWVGVKEKESQPAASE